MFTLTFISVFIKKNVIDILLSMQGLCINSHFSAKLKLLTSWVTPSLPYRITHPKPQPQYPYISKIVILSLFKKTTV